MLVKTSYIGFSKNGIQYIPLWPFCSLKQILAFWVHCSNSALLASGCVILAKIKTAVQFYCDPINLNPHFIWCTILVSVSISLFHYVRIDAVCFSRLLLYFTPHCFIKAEQGFHRESTHVLFRIFIGLDEHFSSLEFGSECAQIQIQSLTYSCLNASIWKQHNLINKYTIYSEFFGVCLSCFLICIIPFVNCVRQITFSVHS